MSMSTTHFLPSRRALVADLDLTAPAKSAMRHGLVRPADLRMTVSPDEIAAADARYRAQVQSRYDRVTIAAWEQFESGQIDHDAYRATVRAARAEYTRRMI